jgi:hypothetical protein
MIAVLRTLVAASMAATLMSFATAMPAGAQDACLSNRDIQAKISSGEIAPVAQVLERNGIDRDTEVLSVEVCAAGNGWSYYVGVIDASGQARTLVLQASG